jgi:hypothetical protein
MRLAFGAPLGNSVSNTPAGTDALVGFPIWVDVGYRFLRHYYVGGFVEWAILLVPNTCPNTCYDTRFGIEAEYHGESARSDPWFGVGAGYEIFHAGGNGDTLVYRGWELLNLEGGIDFFGDRKAFGVGPFMAVSFGQYDHVHTTAGNTGGSADVQNIALHEWVILGARGQYNL